MLKNYPEHSNDDILITLKHPNFIDFCHLNCFLFDGEIVQIVKNDIFYSIRAVGPVGFKTKIQTNDSGGLSVKDFEYYRKNRSMNSYEAKDFVAKSDLGLLSLYNDKNTIVTHRNHFVVVAEKNAIDSNGNNCLQTLEPPKVNLTDNVFTAISNLITEIQKA